MLVDWRRTWRLLGTSSLKEGAILHVTVRFPWRRDVGVLSRNNANTLVAISLMTLAAARHYYVRDNGHGERHFLWLRDCCLRTSIGWWSQFVLGRLREKVLLKKSPAGHVSCYSGR
jgi:hypothetical protein